MSTLAYHAAWLAAALAGIAVASALIARHLRTRELRRLTAEDMLQALACYSEWVADQRRAPAFQGGAKGEPSLDQAHALGRTWFPELSAAMAELAALHDELVDFLARQEALRLADPELWLESDHDGRFMALWREHRLRMHRVAERLRLAARPAIDAEPESIFPA
ncbi:MAG TPA: hypothetical protein VD932_08080 [Aquabacterium sp.]|nr:hypothetical protein [Aquabacterium sp.]